MSSQIFTPARLFTRAALVVAFLFSWTLSAQADWKIDLSRRVDKKRQTDLRNDPTEKQNESTIFDWFVDKQGGGGTTQELVVLNTEMGFIPATIRVREGGNYKIHVVNVNERERNVSFVMDSFSEHHATYFGKIKTFTISPKKEGVFSFVCPETSAQGQLVVHAPPGTGVRQPASED
ncbi:MAG: cupredoxin domain-containing protein [Bdellovibrionaceae bacterium]|nr:cupredoxin domain-containing protein [Bdellovibrionales bacterium]MCB9086623.1 cupredoxin domain-containing protein [Pseudobdellovibrionaceae bacterium]